MPHVTSATLQTLNQGLKAAFAKGVESVPPLQAELTMETQSSHGIENYSWVKQLPVVKEFLTAREFQNSEMVSMAVANKNYEETIEVKYTDIRDDNISQYSTIMSAMGESLAYHPRSLIFKAIRSGLSALGVDGVPFFSNAHPTYDETGAASTFDNVIEGVNEGWVLLDNSRSFMRPIVFQNREAPRMDLVGGAFDDRGNFIGMSIPFGTWASYAAALFMPHLALASFQPLTADNVYGAMQAMSSIRKQDGSYANVNATHIVVSPANRQAAENLFSASLTVQGGTNTLANSLKIIVAPEMTGWFNIPIVP
jgi:phage major head subunit gpT-like protein